MESQITSSREKIKDLADVSGRVAALRAEGKRVVQCHGCFDLVHPGHIRHLEAAKQEGDVLVVTVTPDRHVAKGPGRPVFNERLRAESIAALQCVDLVGINRWPTAVEAIELLRPDVFVKGSDYSQCQDLTGNLGREEAAVKRVGGRLHITEVATLSTTKLLDSYFETRHSMEAASSDQ